MEIREIETIVTRIPTRDPIKHTRNVVLGFGRQVYVKVHTDDGIIGIGECWGFGAPKAYSEVIRESLRPILLERDPLQIEQVVIEMQRATSYYWQGIVSCAISGVELALWDIKGKFHHKSVCEILGRRERDIVKAYATIPYKDRPEALVKTVSTLVQEGYRAIKINNTEPQNIKAVRDIAGKGVEIMIDAHHSWNLKEAVRRLRELERYEVSWIEEPIWPPDDYDALSTIASKTTIPLASGENEYTLMGYREMITKGAVSILQPELTKVGIFTAKGVYSMVKASGLRIIPHCGNNYIGKAATLNFLAHMRTDSMYENNTVGLKENPLNCRIEVTNGYATVPSGPGLGVELNEEVVSKYRG